MKTNHLVNEPTAEWVSYMCSSNKHGPSGSSCQSTSTHDPSLCRLTQMRRTCGAVLWSIYSFTGLDTGWIWMWPCNTWTRWSPVGWKSSTVIQMEDLCWMMPSLSSPWVLLIYLRHIVRNIQYMRFLTHNRLQFYELWWKTYDHLLSHTGELASTWEQLAMTANAVSGLFARYPTELYVRKTFLAKIIYSISPKNPWYQLVPAV